LVSAFVIAVARAVIGRVPARAPDASGPVSIAGMSTLIPLAHEVDALVTVAIRRAVLWLSTIRNRA
jgi:hypothetical protein